MIPEGGRAELRGIRRLASGWFRVIINEKEGETGDCPQPPYSFIIARGDGQFRIWGP
jgi:hypothetical protein